MRSERDAASQGLNSSSDLRRAAMEFCGTITTARIEVLEGENEARAESEKHWLLLMDDVAAKPAFQNL